MFLRCFPESHKYIVEAGDAEAQNGLNKLLGGSMEDIINETGGQEQAVVEPKESSNEGSSVPEKWQAQGHFPLAMTMDSTSIPEFSIVDNTKYSQQIIAATRAGYNPERRAELKRGPNLEEFLAESKRQILTQWHGYQALGTHSDMFCVLFQINVGIILNEVEPTFKKKKHYMAWVRKNFGVKHLRYLQQARALADMGDFAREHAAAGKNRLLVLYSLMKVEKKSECIALFEGYPLPDITEDDDGQILKHHVDTVITLHRLHNAGIASATFDHAGIVASLLKDAINVQKVNQIEQWLKSQAEDERPALFDRYIQDHMTYPPEQLYIPAPRASLNKILDDLLKYERNGDVENDEWLERERTVVDVNALMSAQRLLGELITKMGCERPADTATI